MTEKSTRLALELRTYSDECCTHRHDYHQLVLPVRGELDMNIAMQGGAVSGVYGAHVHADTDHAFAAEGENCFLVMDIPPSLVTSLVRLPAWFSLGPTAREYLLFLTRVLRPSSQFTDLSVPGSQQMGLLLIQLLLEHNRVAAQAPDRRVELVRSYLQDNPEKNMTLPFMAGLANVSPRQLTTLFREAYGCTPQQYLLQQRMQRAEQLLISTTLPVQQVAEQCGYSSLAAFSDRVKRHFGHAPLYFRAPANIASSPK